MITTVIGIQRTNNRLPLSIDRGKNELLNRNWNLVGHDRVWLLLSLLAFGWFSLHEQIDKGRRRNVGLVTTVMAAANGRMWAIVPPTVVSLGLFQWAFAIRLDSGPLNRQWNSNAMCRLKRLHNIHLGWANCRFVWPHQATSSCSWKERADAIMLSGTMSLFFAASFL